MTRVCTSCFRELELSAFCRIGKNNPKPKPHCRDCLKRYKRKWYLAHRQEAIDAAVKYARENPAMVRRVNEKQRARRARLLAELQARKQSNQCS